MNTANYIPGAAEIETAQRARKGLKQLFRTGHVDRLEPEYRKAMSSFSFGNNGFILAPEMSDRVLRCIVEPTDVSGLVDTIGISGPSVRFLIDNARMTEASWVCESSSADQLRNYQHWHAVSRRDGFDGFEPVDWRSWPTKPIPPGVTPLVIRYCGPLEATDRIRHAEAGWGTT